MSQREVARVLKLDRNTVAMIEKSAINKIKKVFEARGIDIKILLED
jgi:transcriptional regulator